MVTTLAKFIRVGDSVNINGASLEVTQADKYSDKLMLVSLRDEFGNVATIFPAAEAWI